jgi:hypothetical protein
VKPTHRIVHIWTPAEREDNRIHQFAVRNSRALLDLLKAVHATMPSVETKRLMADWEASNR